MKEGLVDGDISPCYEYPLRSHLVLDAGKNCDTKTDKVPAVLTDSRWLHG